MADSRSASVELRLRRGIGEALPPSLELVSTRLTGLLGEVRRRGTAGVLTVRRTGGRWMRALGGNGTAWGELTGEEMWRMLSEMVRRDGDNGEGEKGADPAEGDCDLSR